MLIIRRRSGESLLIGNNVEIEVLDIAGGQVKLGVRAPREISILRQEIVLTARQNETAAVAATTQDVQQILRFFPPNTSKIPSTPADK